MYPYSYNIRFLIKHNQLPLNEISKKLKEISGILPSKVANAGEDRVDIKGNKLGSKYLDSRWGFGFFKEWQNSRDIGAPESVEKILEGFQSHTQLFEDMAKKNYYCELIISLGVDQNIGEIFPPQLLGKLADLNIALGLDLYPPEK